MATDHDVQKFKLVNAGQLGLRGAQAVTFFNEKGHPVSLSGQDFRVDVLDDLPIEIPADSVVELEALTIEPGIYLVSGGAQYSGDMVLGLISDTPDLDTYILDTLETTSFKLSTDLKRGSWAGQSSAYVLLWNEPTTIHIIADSTGRAGGEINLLALRLFEN